MKKGAQVYLVLFVMILNCTPLSVLFPFKDFFSKLLFGEQVDARPYSAQSIFKKEKNRCLAGCPKEKKNTDTNSFILRLCFYCLKHKRLVSFHLVSRLRRALRSPMFVSTASKRIALSVRSRADLTTSRLFASRKQLFRTEKIARTNSNGLQPTSDRLQPMEL